MAEALKGLGIERRNGLGWRAATYGRLRGWNPHQV